MGCNTAAAWCAGNTQTAACKACSDPARGGEGRSRASLDHPQQNELVEDQPAHDEMEEGHRDTAANGVAAITKHMPTIPTDSTVATMPASDGNAVLTISTASRSKGSRIGSSQLECLPITLAPWVRGLPCCAYAVPQAP